MEGGHASSRRDGRRGKDADKRRRWLKRALLPREYVLTNLNNAVAWELGKEGRKRAGKRDFGANSPRSTAGREDPRSRTSRRNNNGYAGGAYSPGPLRDREVQEHFHFQHVSLCWCECLLSSSLLLVLFHSAVSPFPVEFQCGKRGRYRTNGASRCV